MPSPETQPQLVSDRLVDPPTPVSSTPGRPALPTGADRLLGAAAMRRIIRAMIPCLLLLVAAAALGQSGQPITYIHDELGRLVGVVHPNGEAAVYSYL